MTPAAWHARVLRVLSDLDGAPTPHLIGVTRSLPAVSVVYLDESAQVMLPEVARALCDEMPPFALIGYCVATMTHYPLADSPPEEHRLMLVASLDDDDSVMVTHSDGEWRLFDMISEGDGWSRLRMRLWDLLLQSNLPTTEGAS